MNSTLETSLIGVLAVTLFNLLGLFHAKRRRRIADAKLEIAAVVTEMEQVMLRGEITTGSSGHDEVHAVMIGAQAADDIQISAGFGRPAPQQVEAQRRLQREIAGNDTVGFLMLRLANASFRQFRYQHPFRSLFFVAWVVSLDGSLRLLISCLRMIYPGHVAWREFKQRVTTWSVAQIDHASRPLFDSNRKN